VPAGEHKVMAGGDDLAQLARQRAHPAPAPNPACSSGFGFVGLFYTI
jgi:hypothetical protein